MSDLTCVFRSLIPRLKFLQGPCRNRCLAPLCASPECLAEVWEKTDNSPLGRENKISNSGRQRDWCASWQNPSMRWPPPLPSTPTFLFGMYSFRSVSLMLVNLPVFLNVKFKNISVCPGPVLWLWSVECYSRDNVGSSELLLQRAELWLRKLTMWIHDVICSLRVWAPEPQTTHVGGYSLCASSGGTCLYKWFKV